MILLNLCTTRRSKVGQLQLPILQLLINELAMICQQLAYKTTSLPSKKVCICKTALYLSGIGAVVKVVDSHLCGWGSIPGKSCSFLIVSLSKSLSLYFMCSDQHVKYWMPRGFSLTSNLLLDYHVKQYTHTHAHFSQYRSIHIGQLIHFRLVYKNLSVLTSYFALVKSMFVKNSSQSSYDIENSHCL